MIRNLLVGSFERKVFAISLVSLLVAYGGDFMPAAAQSTALTIEPNGGTFPINTTAQFRALYNGTDVTSQATWLISGAFTNDPRRGDLLAPGQFRLLYGGNDVYVQARYQGANASAQLSVQGAILESSFRLISSKRNLKSGETATVKAEYSEGRTCPTTDCPYQYGDVTSQASWSISNPSVLQMTSPGVFRALTDDPTATVTASYQGQTSSVVFLPVAEDDIVASGITLVREIYHMSDVPFWSYSQGTPFRNAEYLSGGYFVVAGTCSPRVPSNLEKISAQGATNNIGIQGGLYAFRSDGTFVGKRNVCYDGDIPGPSAPVSSLYCNEGAACEGPLTLLPIGPTQVLREMNRPLDTVFGLSARPPLQYEITPTGINLVGKPYAGNRFWDWEERGLGNFQIGNNVVVSEKIVSVRNKFDGPSAGAVCSRGRASGYRYSNIIQTTGSFGTVREWSNPYVCPSGTVSGGQPYTLPEVVPMAGVGDYLVARLAQDLSTGEFSPAVTVPRVYRLRQDNTLEEVQQLPGVYQTYLASSKDSANPNRIAFVVVNPAAERGATNVVVYEAGSNGLTLVHSVKGPPFGFPFALMGDYIAYSACDLPPQESTPGVADAHTPCGVRVWKGAEEIAAFPLPRTTGNGVQATAEYADRASTVELAPNGNMIVGTEGGHLYLYRIGGAAPSGLGACPPGGFTADLSRGTTHPQVRFLQRTLNKNADTRVAATGPGSPGSETDFFGELTEAAVERFQAKHAIAQAGDPGYGLVGALTRSRLNQVCAGASGGGADTGRTGGAGSGADIYLAGGSDDIATLQSRILELRALLQALQERLNLR